MVRLLLVAALVVLASGATLPYSVRQFTRRDIRGTYTLFAKIPGCPQKIYHEGANQEFTQVLHGQITIGVACDNNGEMDLFPITNGDRVNAALDKLNGTSKDLATSLIENARKVPGSVVGTSNVDRICGATTINKNSIFVFVSSNKTFTVTDGFQIQANRRGMVYIESESDAYCTYDAKPVTPLAQIPSASASPTPVSSTGPPAPGNGATETPPNGNDTTADPTPAGTDTTTNDTTTTPAPGPDGAAVNESDPTPTPESDGVICFPRSATVELEDGSIKTMGQVEIGDRVRVGVNSFSDVFMFTHKLSSGTHKFVQLSTASGHSLALTRGHYLNVNGALQAAKTVKLGDELTLGNGVTSTVTRVTVVEDVGLYNPQTVDGSIVVDNVLASTYTTTVEMGAAHSMLSPLRFVYNFFGFAMTALESGADSIAPMLPKGSAVC